MAARGDVGDYFLQMYTSGTTGFPKGAMLTQRSLMAHTRAGVPTFGFDVDSVAMVAMPLFHVSGVSWALQCIAVGGVTIVVRDVVPADILDALTRERVSHAFFVPAVYQSFLAVPGVVERDYSSLRCLGYGGPPIERPLLERCLQVFEGVDFFQIYGMTELSGAFCVLGPAEHRDRAHPERLRLPPLAPRYYSISSSPLVSPRHCAITVGHLAGVARSGLGMFHGVCSSHLCASHSASAFVWRLFTSDRGA